MFPSAFDHELATTLAMAAKIENIDWRPYAPRLAALVPEGHLPPAKAKNGPGTQSSPKEWAVTKPGRAS